MPKNMNGPLMPYNIVVNEESNSAEINMYGEVVATRPTDWWTGEAIPGNFIAQDEFLRDLEGLAGKDSITVHICIMRFPRLRISTDMRRPELTWRCFPQTENGLPWQTTAWH